ncbi:MAG: GTPase family protein [Gammaproteobacteria bacterium]
MLNKNAWPWMVILLLGSIPVLALLAAGGWLLWDKQLLLPWLALSLSCGGIAWIGGRELARRQRQSPFETPVEPDLAFSQRDREAWQAVDQLCEREKKRDKQGLDKIETWMQLGREALATVAALYRPQSKHPELDIPATELLRIVEQVSHDIHAQLIEHIPFSHRITLAEGLNLHGWVERLRGVNTMIRISRMVLNPFAGALSEAGNYAKGKTFLLTLTHLQDWLLEVYIKKVGYYAIMLYSGRMALAAEQVETLSPESKQDESQALDRQQGLEKEPLRILVAGQTNAGKSTLINTLFDSPRAAADVVSCTPELTPYLLEREGRRAGLIFDTPGYGERTNWLAKNRDELDKTDLLLLVCDANNAARAADKAFLDGFRQHFKVQGHRKIPPMILVVTHIDQLRPLREWQPPYDIEQPKGSKAHSIRSAVDAIREDLTVGDEVSTVPLSLGPNDGLGVYNVDSLMEAMGRQMDEANRSRLLRCLNEAGARENWNRLWQQMKNSGRWLLHKADDALP